jgi:ABC-2 type transport system ATP-binding protein
MIRIVDLQKSYGGTLALGPVDFELKRGETLGILGRNGAGKTTLLRILAGDLRPSAGAVWIDGIDALRHPHEARARIGYLPETPPVYEDMRVVDFLAFAGRLRGMTPGQVDARLHDVEVLTQISHVDHQLIRHLSYGYRQRVGVAQAIIHDPPLLILDEPTHDLDPVQIVEMRKLIQALKGKHTVILSSHILPEIRETCDQLLVIASGRIVARGSEDELTGRLLGERRLRVSVRAGATAGSGRVAGVVARASVAAGAPEAHADARHRVEALMRGIPGVGEVRYQQGENGTLTFAVSTVEDCRAEVCRALVLAGHDVLQLERAERELENVFLELVGEGDGARD